MACMVNGCILGVQKGIKEVSERDKEGMDIGRVIDWEKTTNGLFSVVKKCAFRVASFDVKRRKKVCRMVKEG